MTTNLKNASYDNETAKARAELVRRAEAEGIKPFTSLEDVAGDAQMISDFDVDGFLRQVREDRDRHSIRRSTDGDPGH